jgi:hypothetical protein
MAFQTITLARLAQAAIPVTNTTIYTVPALTRTMVKCITLANTTAASITVALNLVPSAGSPAAANTLLPTIPVLANSVFQLDTAQVMNAGDFINVIASATGCTATISGGEAT